MSTWMVQYVVLMTFWTSKFQKGPGFLFLLGAWTFLGVAALSGIKASATYF